MDNKKRILWITRTAVFIALLVALQAVTRPLGQYVTGSVVNLILILSVMLGGLASGITVAVLSPLFAFILGIGPQIFPVVPFIMLGNLALVLVWHFVAGKAKPFSTANNILAAVLSSIVKFGVLYLGVVIIAVPLFGLPAAMQVMFSFPQLITAAIGGTVAILMLPLLGRVLQKQQ